MKSLARLTVAALALLLAPLSALAAGPGTPPTYTDEATFLSQIVAGSAESGNFNDLTLGFFYSSPLSARTVAPYSYVASTGDGSQFLTEGDPVPKNVWLTTTLPNTVINLAVSNAGNPVEAFGGQFFALDSSGNFAPRQVTVSVNGGAYSISKTPTSIADSFFGFILGTEVGGLSSVEISVGATANTYAATNSVTFAVPEPSTYALLGLAITTGGLCRIRRRLSGKKAA